MDGAVANFSRENFSRGVKSTQFVNAPAGFIYPGDPGFPSGRSGFNAQWRNLSPRAGVAWDVTGDGRMAVRSSYGALKLSAQRRSANGISLNGNYTLSRCFGLDWANTGGNGGGIRIPTIRTTTAGTARRIGPTSPI